MKINQGTDQLPRRRSLENEIITAVVILYLLLAVIMIVVHYLQPSGQETATSSTSLSHSEHSTGKSDNR
ncbi:MAG: hypothetical protein H0X02_11780 [Nitrosomonas sp.]|nr:hypothetical protein [Nitrosomonas sp.]